MAGRGQKYTQEFKDSTIQLALSRLKYATKQNLSHCFS